MPGEDTAPSRRLRSGVTHPAPGKNRSERRGWRKFKSTAEVAQGEPLSPPLRYQSGGSPPAPGTRCIPRDPPEGHGHPGAAASRSHGQTGLTPGDVQRWQMLNARMGGCPGGTCSALAPGDKGSHCAGKGTPPPAEPRPPRGLAQEKPRPCQSQHGLQPPREEAARRPEPSLSPKRKPPPASSDAAALGVFASSPPRLSQPFGPRAGSRSLHKHFRAKPPRFPSVPPRAPRGTE